MDIDTKAPLTDEEIETALPAPSPRVGVAQSERPGTEDTDADDADGTDSGDSDSDSDDSDSDDSDGKDSGDTDATGS